MSSPWRSGCCKGKGGSLGSSHRPAFQLHATTQMAGLHLGHHRELLTPETTGAPCNGRAKGTGYGKEEPINYPHSLIPPMAVEALGSGDRKVAQDPLWPFSCLQPGLQLSQKGVWGGQCRLPRLQSRLQESDIFPEESQPWLSLCSLPWGVVWSSRSRYQLDSTLSFLPNSVFDPPQVESPDISLQVANVKEQASWSFCHPQMLFAHSWRSLPGQPDPEKLTSGSVLSSTSDAQTKELRLR